MSSKLRFASKGENLQDLIGVLKHGKVKPLIVFKVSDWQKSSSEILTNIKKCLAQGTLIVRSSAVAEDTCHGSMAGAFLSVANVKSNSKPELKSAIEKVISSFRDNNSENQVIVQEQVLNIKMSGVLFTRDLDNLAPYFIANYDDQTSSHDSVTSGTGSHLKTWIRYKNAKSSIQKIEHESLVKAARELEGLYSCDALDIEFAFDAKDDLYILQVRPIATKRNSEGVTDEEMTELLYKIERKYAKLDAPHPELCGSRAIFSVMTDWNPAEIIGIKPGKLALSLYKQLITDNIWAYQRSNYGYRNLRGFPLLISFHGFPYIDVRASLNSFVPQELNEALASKLIDYYLDSLCASPTEHDKVEFNIVFSCYYLSIPQRLKKLAGFGFSELELDRIKFALLNLTNKVLSPTEGLYKKDYQKIHQLEQKYKAVKNSGLSLIDKIYWIIEDTMRFGTLPFAGLARAGFIAVQFLKSFVELKIISEGEYQRFMNSLNTVTRQLSQDCEKLNSKKISKESFLEKYGHLRPGTYDILSRRYDEAFDVYFDNSRHATATSDHSSTFEFSQAQLDKISEKLLENGVQTSAQGLIKFIREAIEGREYSKFIFTKGLSDILVLLTELGAKHGIKREDLAELDIKVVLDLYANLTPRFLPDILKNNIEINRADAKSSGSLKLPQLIAKANDIYEFYLSEVEPNFVTDGRVTEIVIVEENLLNADISNKIVFIKSADPGYDWMFSKNIAGLVTMYGGANSHMAIRCAELKIPAVIGCGEQNFKLWSSSGLLEMDCANRQVRVINSKM